MSTIAEAQASRLPGNMPRSGPAIHEDTKWCASFVNLPYLHVHIILFSAVVVLVQNDMVNVERPPKWPSSSPVITTTLTADPIYTPPAKNMLSSLSAMQPRQLAAQVLNFALVLSTAFMIWKGLSVVTDSSSPIVVVLSGSMEPAFQRGDLLFLWNRGANTQVGEVVVYTVKGKDIPIVHRVVRRFGGG